MSLPEASDITRLLVQWSRGDESALKELAPLVQQELHRIASVYLGRERRAHTLQPTALVHEAYIRLLGTDQPEWDGRGHFFAFAARLMRQVLVDYARKHSAAKRNAGLKVTLGDVAGPAPGGATDLLALDQALTELAQFDSRKSRIVELRYFAGMGVEETAVAMDLSISTVRRELRMAEAWLHRAMCPDAEP